MVQLVFRSDRPALGVYQSAKSLRGQGVEIFANLDLVAPISLAGCGHLSFLAVTDL